MAESPTPPTSGSGTSQPTTPAPSSSSPKQYIKPSSYDDELEPDALRGSEQVIKDAGVIDREIERREKINPPEEPKK